MRLLFLYFSGTGNTDYVSHYLAQKLSRPGVEVELRSIEWQPPECVTGFDLLALGFPVYAVDSPVYVQDYVARLPEGDGRGAFVFCTKGAWAGDATRLNLQRLAARGYVPLESGTVGMPGSDGLAMLSKGSRMARMALEKDYDRLKDADRLADRMHAVLTELLSGHSVESLSQPLPARSGPTLADRTWAWLYGITEDWARIRLHADDTCQGCGLCYRLCPVDNIAMRDGHPHFQDRCILCIRCLHACPEEAIQISRLTRGKFRWRGPKGEFKPLRMRSES